ncbi:FtsX-like permease family protein [Streptomyces sp. NPDC058620]|uniref:FtsX-like permease family protein n=1 Tax=Streptomyces sp. NPDC058620 TaxID=3346560 RepID=UPI00364A6A8F
MPAAAVRTLALIPVGRRGEFRLLRVAGAGRRQVSRTLLVETGLFSATGLAVGTLVAAVPLVAFSVSVTVTVTGAMPYLPPGRYGALAAAVVVAATIGTVGPGSSDGRFALKRRAG